MRVFIHCLIKANYRDKNYKGNVIKRGSFLTSLQQLSYELDISVQQTRTALDKLKSTNELTIISTNKGTQIFVANYTKYQNIQEELTNKPTSMLTDNQQTNNTLVNKQITTTKEYKERKEYKEEVLKKENIKEKKYFDLEELNKLFLEFLDLRKKIKAVNSERAISSLLNKLNKYPDDIKIEMLNKSIINSWKDVYELKKGGVKDNERSNESFASTYERKTKW